MGLRRVMSVLATMLTLGVGCASDRSDARMVVATPLERPPVASAALAFTPPVARDLPDDLGLDRTGRVAYATAGFEDVVISETFVRTDDRQRFGRFGDQGQYERRAVSTTVTVRQR